MLATMMGLIVACKPFEENISQFDQNKVYQKDPSHFIINNAHYGTNSTTNPLLELETLIVS